MATTEWPGLVGRPWQEVVAIIRGEYKGMTIQVIPEGYLCETEEYNVDRVKIYVDSEGIVMSVPAIG